MKFLTHQLQVLNHFYEHTEHQLALKPILRKHYSNGSCYSVLIWLLKKKNSMIKNVFMFQYHTGEILNFNVITLENKYQLQAIKA